MIVECYECGGTVTIAENIKGIITGINNRFGSIEYEVSYFFDGIHYSVWIHESEFSTSNEKKKVGFINCG
jgi:hypothetical protein